MKKILFSLAAISIVVISQSFMDGDDCTNGYYPTKKGTEFQLKLYSDKDKLVGRTDVTISNVTSSGNEMKIAMDYKMYDNKDKFLQNSTCVSTCENGNYHIEMSTSMGGGLSDLKTKTTVDGDYPEFPATLTPGMVLKESTVNVTLEILNDPRPGNHITKSTTETYNRKVICDTTITSPAGTFKCVKVVEDTKTSSGFGGVHITHSVTYLSKNVGSVRAEVYNEKGKLQTYSLLTRIRGN